MGRAGRALVFLWGKCTVRSVRAPLFRILNVPFLPPFCKRFSPSWVILLLFLCLKSVLFMERYTSCHGFLLALEKRIFQGRLELALEVAREKTHLESVKISWGVLSEDTGKTVQADAYSRCPGLGLWPNSWILQVDLFPASDTNSKSNGDG